MKKQGLLIMFILCLSIISFLFIIKASDTKLNNRDLLSIGEEKYLKFLWMVDGAFNNQMLKEEFTVNGKKINNKDLKFSCNYKKNNKNTCEGNNFLEEFYNLFSSSIKYDHVYGDGLTYSWIKNDNNKFYFTNPNDCNIKRMGLNHILSIKEITDNELVFNVNYDNSIYKHTYNCDFVLIYENNDWKIKEAYYYDLCGMEYHIE